MELSIALNSFSFILTGLVGWNEFYYKRNYFFGIFSLLFSVLFCFIPVVDNVILGPAMFHPEAIYGVITDIDIYDTYAITVTFFSLSLLVFSIVLSVNSTSKFNGVKLIVTYKLYFLIGGMFILGFFSFVYSTGYDGSVITVIETIFVRGRMDYHGNAGYSSLMHNLSFYLMSVIALYSYMDVSSRFQKKKISIVVYSLLIVFTVVSGSRQILILALSGFVVGVYYSVVERRKLFNLVSVGFVACLGLFFIQILRAASYDLSSDRFLINNILVAFLRGDVSYFYYSSLEAIRQYTDHDMIFLGNIYRNLSFMLIPTDFTFGLKQRDLSILFAPVYNSDNTFRLGNYPPGLIGLFFLNFGYFGFIFAGWFFIFLLLLSDKLKRTNPFFICFGAVFISWCLQTFRGTLMGFYQFVFVLFVFLLCNFLSKMKCSQYETEYLDKVMKQKQHKKQTKK